MKYTAVIITLLFFCFQKSSIHAQPLPLSEENKATYASVNEMIHVVPFEVGEKRGFIFCNLLQNPQWYCDTISWTNEMKIAYLRALILEKTKINDTLALKSTQHWILMTDQISPNFFRWSDKKLLRKFMRLEDSNNHEVLKLNYVLALWKRGFMFKISSETGHWILVDPWFIPYRDYPVEKM